MDLNWNLCDSNRNLKVSALCVCFCIFLEFTFIDRINSNNVKVNKDIKNKIVKLNHLSGETKESVAIC